MLFSLFICYLFIICISIDVIKKETSELNHFLRFLDYETLINN